MMKTATLTVRTRMVGARRLKLLTWALPLLAWSSARVAFAIAKRVAATCGVDVQVGDEEWQPAARITVFRG